MTPAYMRGSTGSIDVAALRTLKEANGIEHVFSGDWHDRGDWHPNIRQIGALVPTGWDNPGPYYGNLVVFDSVTKSAMNHVIPGPRFLKLKHGEQLHRFPQKGMQVYVQYTVDPAQVVEATAALQEQIDNDEVVAGEIVVSKVATAAAAVSAATAARAAETFEEAVDAYLKAAPIAQGVDRDEVARRVRLYLEG